MVDVNAGAPVRTERAVDGDVASSQQLHARFLLRQAAFTLDVDLRLPGRGVTALFGQSGSGKTTCLRCLAGLAAPQEGYLSVNGEVWLDTRQRIDVPTHRRALGYVFQEASLFAHLKVRDNLRYGLKRVAPADRKVALDHAAALLGIDHLLDRMPAGLSGGERQRVGMARALLTSPRILLMDEPLAALDNARKQEILPYLERLHEELDIPIVYVSHAPEEVARLADHLVLLDQGKVLASGPIGQTLTRLDLPSALADDASVVIEGEVAAYDGEYRLLTVRVAGTGAGGAGGGGSPGGSPALLRVVHEPLPIGRRMRLVVRARDVSLTLTPPQDSSILNVLRVRVEDMAETPEAAQIMVRLDADGTPMLARITRYSRDQLALAPGSQVWAQVKSVSLLA
ncbi:molybdenum ABC transporter ATP-binding protein [Bordetella sp. N]|uniref:molybdenum ABC transporter ATP-binding protein n=1 Tax=Bordetella sp. N TaxID=1746199 RepID=UPI0009E6F4E3|nr:molybdenum ABC transporter ATP-binding protein [Bordetella sp. N]